MTATLARRRPAHQRRRPVQPRGARGPAAHARGPARRRPPRAPDEVRPLRDGPLRAGARGARRLAAVPVRGRRRAVELQEGEAVAAAQPAAGGRPAPARRPAAGAAEGAQPPVAAEAAGRLARRRRGAGRRGAGRRAWSSTASGAWRTRSRCGCSRTPSASARTAGRTCCPTGTTPSTRSGRPTTWSPRARPAWRSCRPGSPPSAGAEALAPEGFGADIWAASDRGDITPEQAPLIVRSLLTAGVDTTVHGISAVLYAFATNPDQWQRLRAEPGAGPGRVRRGGALGVAGADVLPHRDHRRPGGRPRRARGTQDPDVPGVGQPGPAALGEPGRASTSPATRRGTSASAWASTSASASTSPGWRRRRC